jgi:phosphatidylethanolamine-binding protein (PEBP) family uncharacterized protein
MNVVYGEQVAKNQVLARSYTLEQPNVHIKPVPGKQLTLIMSDPDAPQPSWLHWLVTNITGDMPYWESGDVIVSYAPPTPPSGTHRYIFTLYEQHSSIMIDPLSERSNFSVRDFVLKHALKKLVSRQIRVASN